MPKLSVAIPTHSTPNGTKFLTESFDMLYKQSFKDFEVVVTDNSDDYDIEKLCNKWVSFLNLKHYRNPRKGMAQNTNEAILRSSGELVKILYLDDLLYTEHSLKKIVENFKDEDHWLVTGCIHLQGDTHLKPLLPKYSHDIYVGNNTIGSPSVLTIRKEGHLLFDENLTWLLDCDLYKRYHAKYGEPRVVNGLNVVIRQHPDQMTHLLSQEIKDGEFDYLIDKYHE